MRKLTLSLTTALLFGMIFFACSKEEENVVEEVENYTVEEELESETLSADLEKSIDDELAQYGIFFDGKKDLEELDKNGPFATDRNADCATRTASAERGVYPNTVTIQLTEGCTGRNGQSISGTIAVTLSAAPRTEGATKTVTLTDFRSGDLLISGTKTITNDGFVSGSQDRQYTKTVDFTITKNDESTIRRQSTLTNRFVAGADTDTFDDDRWERTGSVSGVNSRGQEYSITITSPIVRIGNCRWPVSGTQELTRGDRTVTIDFGQGECDRMVMATMGDISREFEIKRN